MDSANLDSYFLLFKRFILYMIFVMPRTNFSTEFLHFQRIWPKKYERNKMAANYITLIMSVKGVVIQEGVPITIEHSEDISYFFKGEIG